MSSAVTHHEKRGPSSTRHKNTHQTVITHVLKTKSARKPLYTMPCALRSKITVKLRIHLRAPAGQ